MKPIIGITAESVPTPEEGRFGGVIHLPANYTEMVAKAGGVPIVVPPTACPEDVARLLDGWLIPGGRDLDAANWGEQNHPRVELQDPSRFAFEKALFLAADPNMPILGICYGCQAINVLRGGSLEQHVPDRTGNQEHEGGTLGEARIERGSKLGGIVAADRVEGRCYHHQAVARLGEGLRVVARHADGTVEGVEATDRPWMLGVQWHPERTPESEASRRLFSAFVAAAKEYARSRREATAAR